LSQTLSALKVTLVANPPTVSLLATLAVQIDLDPSGPGVPQGGGFLIKVPTAFDSGSVLCDLIEPSLTEVLSCGTTTNIAQVMIKVGSAISAEYMVYLQIGKIVNPISTQLNSGFSVSTFDADGVELESLSDLSLSSLQAGIMPQAAIRPEFESLGLPASENSLLLSFTPDVEIRSLSDWQGC